MIPLITQLGDFLHQVLPYVLALAGGLVVALIQRKNRQTAQARFELAAKVDEAANAEHERNISTLEAKVAHDDQIRLELEEAARVDSASTPNPKPRE